MKAWLKEAEFKLVETLVREPNPEVEVATRRAYVFARKAKHYPTGARQRKTRNWQSVVSMDNILFLWFLVFLDDLFPFTGIYFSFNLPPYRP